VETIACLRAHVIDEENDMFATGSSDGTIRIWERRVIDDDTGKTHSFNKITGISS
jgi:elongator complex protein 2